ncbi:MAG: sugar-binding transcriptional regulator [Lachnospiraceae bacterium]|nr:sugar-binding transcriptional regulator [Lachnospiraceae bacterium]
MNEDLIRVANYYYVMNMTQKEIADKIGISRQKVSRLLKKAQDEKIVEIRINGMQESCIELEKELQKALEIEEAYIIPSDDVLTIAEEALSYIANILKSGQSFGVSFGNTLASLFQVTKKISPVGIDVVQLMGGLNTFQDSGYRPDEVTTSFANILGGKAHSLFIPAILDNLELKRLIYEEKQFHPMLERIKNVDIAFVAIGSLEQDLNNILIRDGYFSSEQLERYRERGSVGEVCFHIYDINGELIDPEYDKHIVGITVEDFKNIPKKIGFAYGPHKVFPIIAAARGNYLNSLVTNKKTAEMIMAYLREEM